MSRRDKKSIGQKIAEVNALWDNEEKFALLMPDREMYYCFAEDDDVVCICAENNLLIESVCLDKSTDWLSWELELME